MSKITLQFNQIFQLWPKFVCTRWLKLRKRKWNPLFATLWQGEFNIRCWHHTFNFIIYTVQLYKENCTILHMLGCRAIGLPSTEEIVVGLTSCLLYVHTSVHSLRWQMYVSYLLTIHLILYTVTLWAWCLILHTWDIIGHYHYSCTPPQPLLCILPSGCLGPLRI